jgi:hypothetical protein
MKVTPPPRLATWLLERLAPGEKRESLAGDLIEQHRNGHSASWYWRQTLTAILAGAAADIRAHKLLAVRAVMIGFAAMWAFSELARFSLQLLWALSSGGVYVGGHWISLSYGWIRYPRYLGLVLASIGSAGSGWIVGRMHRGHQAPMVFAFLASVVVVAMAQLSFQVRLIGWSIRPHYQGQYAVAVLLFFVFVSTSILLGGLWSAGTSRTRTTSARQDAAF